MNTGRGAVPFRKLGKEADEKKKNERFVVRAVYNPSFEPCSFKPGDTLSEDYLIDLIRHHGAHMKLDRLLTFETRLACYRFYCDNGIFLILHDLCSKFEFMNE